MEYGGNVKCDKFKSMFVRSKLEICELETQEVEPIPPLYFGYGSNLDIFQMRRRCLDCVPVQAARLPGYLLTFSGVLTVEEVLGAFVLGGLYEVSYQDEVSLDLYEGYPYSYTKRFTYAPVDGERRLVFFYVLERPYEVSPPSYSYYETVAQGYRTWGLDITELQAARARSWSVRKSYYEKAATNWASKRQMAWADSPTLTYMLDEYGTPIYDEWNELPNL